MGAMIDVERLVQLARVSGALSGNERGGVQAKEASTPLTLSTLPSIYGSTSLFQPYGDNNLITFAVTDEPFLNWLNFRPHNEYKQIVKVLTYIGPAGTAAGTQTNGAAAACAAGAGVEFGKFEFLLPDKGRLKRTGPVRDLTENGRKPWADYPVFTKEGEQITDELMWSLILAGTAIKQDLMRMIINGNHANANEFAGLQTLVNTGYKDLNDGHLDTAIDSTVLNWNNQTFSYTINGYSLVDFVMAYVRRVRMRASWSSIGEIGQGDMIIMLPAFLRDKLLDAFTCWSVCPGSAYNESNMNTFEARTFRERLNGGQYGDGQIFVDGQAVPCMIYNWQPFTAGPAPYFTGDIYILTRQIGGMPVLYGQYIDMTEPARRYAEEAGVPHYAATDNGRFLTYWKTTEECTQATVVLRPNIYLSAPWAQVRIQNVAARPVLDPLSVDPTSPYFVGGEITTPPYPSTTPADYTVLGL